MRLCGNAKFKRGRFVSTTSAGIATGGARPFGKPLRFRMKEGAPRFEVVRALTNDNLRISRGNLEISEEDGDIVVIVHEPGLAGRVRWTLEGLRSGFVVQETEKEGDDEEEKRALMDAPETKEAYKEYSRLREQAQKKDSKDEYKAGATVLREAFNFASKMVPILENERISKKARDAISEFVDQIRMAKWEQDKGVNLTKVWESLGAILPFGTDISIVDPMLSLNAKNFHERLDLAIRTAGGYHYVHGKLEEEKAYCVHLLEMRMGSPAGKTFQVRGNTVMLWNANESDVTEVEKLVGGNVHVPASGQVVFIVGSNKTMVMAGLKKMGFSVRRGTTGN